MAGISCLTITFILITSLVSNVVTHHHHNTHPNIVFILADDAGWNDFSFHGSAQIPTPNIDALALNGMILNSYYTPPLCTPTRGAIMTGKHPIHLGLQHYVVRGATSGGLPLSEKLLPAYLKELGYSTHLVGKWHLGHSRKANLPTERGFDSHFGYWLGKQDYYSHISMDGKDDKGEWCWGYDFRSNQKLNRSAFGRYSTDILTNEAVDLIENHSKDSPLFLMLTHMAPHSANYYDPLQAPVQNIRKFSETVRNKNRGMYAAMIDKLDESVGSVVDALSRRGMLSDSIIVFASDNGGAPDGYDLNYGSNWPLRGVKNTLWEGGTRVAAAIWSPLIQNRVSRDLMHAQDWLPTLFEAAGGNVSELTELDGVSLWKTLISGAASPRTSFLYNIDNAYGNSAIREGPWKLIQGVSYSNELGAGVWDQWHGESGQENGNNSKLIPQIISSLAGTAILSSGFTMDEKTMAKLQTEAIVYCNLQVDSIACDPAKAPCLFHVEDDPCEMWNVANKERETVQRLLNQISEYNKTSIPSNIWIRHPEGNAANWGNVWTTWEDELEADFSGNANSYSVKTPFTGIITFMIMCSLFINI